MAQLFECVGVLIPFGSPGTPVDMRLTKRFDPATGREIGLHFLPVSGIPTTLGPDRPREASPTGKSGMGIAMYSQPRQPIESARRVYIMQDTDPIYAGTVEITQSVVDPYRTLLGQPTPGPKVDKWTG